MESIIDADQILDRIKKEDIILYPSQTKLSIPILNRIYRKMKANIEFENIKTSNGLIIDGHHRYVSSILAGKKIGHQVYQSSSVTRKYDWSMIEFVDEEWDTQDKIKLLNKLDAERNNLTEQEIIDIKTQIP